LMNIKRPSQPFARLPRILYKLAFANRMVLK